MNKTIIKTTIHDIDNAIKMFEDILEVNRKNNIFSRSAHQRIQVNMINLRTTKHHLEQMLKDLNNDKSSQNNDRLFEKMLDGAQSLCEEHEDIVKNIVDEPTITCVTNDVATTPSANTECDTPCFENIEELNK